MICISKRIKTIVKDKMISVGILEVFSYVIITSGTFVKAFGISELITIATQGDAQRTIRIAAILLISLILCHIVLSLISVYKDRCFFQVAHQCRMVFIKGILDKKLSFVSTMQTGDLFENVTDDLQKTLEYYGKHRPTLICRIIQLLLYGVLVFTHDPIVCIVLLIIASLQVIPPVVVTKYMEKCYGETREIEAKLTEHILRTFDMLAEIKRNCAESWVIERFQKLNYLAYKVDIKNQMLLQSETSMDNLMSNLMSYGTYAFLGMLTLNGLLPLDSALQIMILSSSLFEATKSIFDNIQLQKIAMVAVQRLSSVFDEEEIAMEFAGPEIKTNMENSICFRNFSFENTKENRRVFSNLNLRIPTNEICIVVGENGAGKSLLIKHILGQFHITNGEVLFCGMIPEKWEDSVRSEYLFYLPQDTPVFSLTPLELFESFHEKQKKRMDISQSLIERFGLRPDIWNTRIQDLSEGERKKIFLALAFSTCNKTLLLLDEPTNSLDQKGVEVLVSLLAERKGGGILVSHNPVITGLPYRKLMINKGDAMYVENLF